MKGHAPTLALVLAPLVLAAPQARAADDKPAPKYEVKVERNVRVRMRDGVALATDIYFPVENGRPLTTKIPAVLQRTPYGKSRGNSESLAAFFAGHGYLSVIQDCRGRFASEGEFVPYLPEPKDGYDTIVWLANHPACNGKVGMFGSSYRTWTQFEAATQRPPGLVTIIADEGPTNGYHYSMHPGGARHLGLLVWTLRQMARSQEAERDPSIALAAQSMFAKDEFLRWAERVPWQRGVTPLSRAPRYEDAAFHFFFEHNNYDDFWRQPGLAMDQHFESFPDMPILWIGGWYDWYPRSISDGYQKMVQLKRKNQYLLIGAWTHDNGPHDNVCDHAGDVHFGLSNAPLRNGDDFLHLQLRWFERWLKGDNRVDVGEPVSVFMMGGGDGKRRDGRIDHGGTWHYPSAWPPLESTPTDFFLHRAGGLSKEKPASKDSSTSYTFDPRTTVSSNTRCFVAFGATLKDKCLGGPHDQIEVETLSGHGMPGMPLASRPDVLVFQTPPLKEDVAIAGNIKIVLHVSSDAPDTDFFVKLIDVHPGNADYPTGYAVQLTDGVLRARFRDSFVTPTLMKPGQVYRIEIHLEPTANLFKAGHRLRVDVSSSNFPSYDINPNTGDPTGRVWRIAQNTVWHDAEHASSIVLPLVKAAAK